VPGVDRNKPLVFSGPVLAEIFRGTITTWNDPAIAKLNPGVRLPDAAITVVHRADGSGTTYVFTDYLCKVSKEFATAPGRGTVVNWPATNQAGMKGSEGVAGMVAKTAGTIGYVELTYALQNRIAYGAVVNAAGKPVHATLASVTAAASSFTHPPADLRMSITNPSGEEAYPIAAFSYLLVYKNQADPAKADALADFLTWAVTDGQRLAPAMGFAPLPSEIVARDHHQILSLSVNGKPFAALR
jgi:phosphate transport system substrate-binding protein